jgi:LacI family transcriptional regulator
MEREDTVRDLVDSAVGSPTAWFCVNDGLGFFVQSALQQKGRDVPDDVSVCSFDNGQLSRLANPKMTTMDIDLELYGRKGVEQLIWRLDYPNEPMTELLLPAKLIKRESTAEVRK